MPLAMYQVMNSFGGFAMSGKSNSIYWDACIFLAHLKGEVRVYSGPKNLDTKTGRAKVHSAHEKENYAHSLSA